MKPSLYWLETDPPARLAVMPRPRGGDWLEEELRRLRAEGVELLVSLLESHEESELDLRSEAVVCGEVGLRYRNHPIPDRGVPTSTEKTVAFIRELHGELRSGAAIAVHCRAGIGRTGMIAAGLLLLNGIPLPEALRRLEKARGAPMPETDEQRRWLARRSLTK